MLHGEQPNRTARPPNVHPFARSVSAVGAASSLIISDSRVASASFLRLPDVDVDDDDF
jgi:hypothetical protein